MSGLFEAISASRSAMEAFQQALDVTQNNVSNVSTPGYAAQRALLRSRPFDPQHGLSGGVTVEILNTRDVYAEQAVQRQVGSLGSSEQQFASLQAIEANFDISGQTGIAGSISQLTQSFSAWSVAPTNQTAREAVISSAQNVARNFQQTSAGLNQISADTTRQLHDTVSRINALAVEIQQYNVERQNNPHPDAGVDANLQRTFEELANLTNVTTTRLPDGTVVALLGGQTPLVVGSNVYAIQLGVATPGNPPPPFPNGVPPVQIQAADGKDITAQVSQGKLAGLLHVRNAVLPSLRGDQNQAGDVNRLAKAFATQVNSVLTSGNISNGPPVQPGVPLFTWDVSNDTATAQTLVVNPAITAQQLAAIDPGPPSSSNGTAVKLAGISDAANPPNQLGGLSFTQFYGDIAARVGQQTADAHNQNSVQKNLLAQAKTFRSQISGVSLDEEAVHLIEYQRAFQAAAKVISTLNQLAQASLDMVK